MTKINEYTFGIGADPEIFVKDTRTDRLISGYGMIPGTKDRPYKVANGAVQVDGMALEFNIDPAYSFGDFNSNIDSVMGSMKSMIGTRYDFAIVPVAEFGKAYIDSQPEEAKELGCMPDFNAYTERETPTPDHEAPFRTASGHIHIGWTKPGWPAKVDPFDAGHFKACCNLAKTLDFYLGIPQFLWDKDTRRRNLYGMPGVFRPKPYGMEYRVLSNKWLLTPETRALVFFETLRAIEELFKSEKASEQTYNGKTASEIILSTTVEENTDLRELLFIDRVKSPSYYRKQIAEGRIPTTRNVDLSVYTGLSKIKRKAA